MYVSDTLLSKQDNAHHVHGGPAECCRHHVALKVPGKAEVRCGHKM